MKQDFLIFQKFSSQKESLDFGRLLNENGIRYLLEDISVNFDPILSNNEFGKEFCVKLQKVDFEKVNEILRQKVKEEIVEVTNDYYLLSFSNEELIDVIQKSDEWNKFDVELALELLKQRGNEVSELQISEITNQRITELSKPEEGQTVYIVIGYISAVCGGLLGIFVGWHLLSFKKTLPNGSRIYAYSESDRKQGNRIFVIGTISILFWFLYFFLK